MAEALLCLKTSNTALKIPKQTKHPDLSEDLIKIHILCIFLWTEEYIFSEAHESFPKKTCHIRSSVKLLTLKY